MSGKVDGLAVGYGLAGFILLYSGWANQPVKSVVTGFLSGKPPAANPSGAVQLSVSNPGSSASASGNTDGNANIPASVGSPTPQGTYSYKQLETLWVLAGGSPSQAPVMAAIAEAESGGNVDAHNPSGASGLWQIEVPVNDQYIPGGASNVYNALDNARAAVAVYKAQGLGAWTTYTSGAYKTYLQG